MRWPISRIMRHRLVGGHVITFNTMRNAGRHFFNFYGNGTSKASRDRGPMDYAATLFAHNHLYNGMLQTRDAGFLQPIGKSHRQTFRRFRERNLSLTPIPLHLGPTWATMVLMRPQVRRTRTKAAVPARLMAQCDAR